MNLPIPDKQSLHQAYNFTRGMSMPTVPDIVVKLYQELSSATPDTQRVADLVGQDHSVTGLVLKTINSPLFGLDKEVESIRHAVMLLGLDKFRNMILSAVLESQIEVKTSLGQQIWRDSLHTAQIAMKLAGHVEGVSTDEAYLAGLLHDSGALLMSEHLPQYQRIWNAKPEHPLSLLRLEQQMLGTTHNIIGYLFSVHWKLSALISSAIFLHHESRLGEIEDDHLRGLVAILKIADMTTDSLFQGSDKSLEQIQAMQTARAELMLDREIIEELTQEVGLIEA